MLMKSGWNRGGRSRKSMNGKRRREKRTERWEKKRRKSSGPSGKGLRCWNGILCDHGLSFQSHHQMMKTAHPTQSQRQSSTGTLDSLAHAFIILQSIPGPKTSLGSYVVHLVLKMLVLPLRNHCVLCPQVWHAICCSGIWATQRYNSSHQRIAQKHWNSREKRVCWGTWGDLGLLLEELGLAYWRW